METNSYWDEYPSAVTICDSEANIIYMNNKAQATFDKWGGEKLKGKSLYDCHTEKSNAKIREILTTGIPNTYTIEKLGIKKLIHQSPWYQNGQIGGLVEISIVLPNEIPHFIRG
jgi:transcriptional regulator with PAS, ATPase and Fis domain